MYRTIGINRQSQLAVMQIRPYPDLDNPAYASDTETEDDYPPMQEPDVVPEPDPESEPEPDRSMDFQCSRCGEVINERVYEYSINKFGEPLCIKCQRGGGRR